VVIIPDVETMDWARHTFLLSFRSLAAMRIGLGLILCGDGLLRARDFPLMYAADGLFPPDILRTSLGNPAAWTVALWSDPWWCGACLLAAEIAAGCFLVAGLGTRWATAAAWVAVVSLARRTFPASNSGDAWLGCLLLWSLFLPLGTAWSLDARRASKLRPHGITPTAGGVVSLGTVALVLQLAAVYLSAGLAKCDSIWLQGDAVTYALSTENHGTPLGAMVAAQPWLAKPLTWTVVAAELAAPILLVTVSAPAPRTVIVAIFILFHAAIGVTMNVGLFAPVGMAAWLALLPGSWWERCAWLRSAPDFPENTSSRHAFNPPGRGATALCAACLAVAAVSFGQANGPWPDRPLPAAAADAVALLGLEQNWRVFGDVKRQQQWVYSRAELADGSVVDLLRGGTEVVAELPPGGFYGLPNHRWHTLFWDLSNPRYLPFAPAVAAGLATHWNRFHGPAQHVRTLELRSAHLRPAPPAAQLHEVLLATWPPRALGRGNLERLLQQQAFPSTP